MKKIRDSIVIMFMLAAALPAISAEPTEADQRWARAVGQKIASGPAVVSTTSESRADLAKAIAQKMGRKATVTKTKDGYSVVVRSFETTDK